MRCARRSVVLPAESAGSMDNHFGSEGAAWSSLVPHDGQSAVWF